MHKIIATAIREFKATALTKGFIFGTFLLPVIIWAVLGAAFALGLFSPERDAIKGTIAIVDSTPDQLFVSGLESYFDKERQEYIRDQKIQMAKKMAKEQADGSSYESYVDRIPIDSIVGKAPEVTIENAGADADIDALTARADRKSVV